MPKNLGGRPPKLQPDLKTLNIVKGLGQIQAVSKECAAVLGVTEPTWIKFKKDHPEVEKALIEGQGEGLASLRRRQFKAAQDGNATMLIWLGKQYLGQADKQEHTGANGGPIQTMDVTNLSDAQLAALEDALAGVAGAAGGASGEGSSGTDQTKH